MVTMTLDLPDSMAEHKEHFEWFIRTMVQKLHVNRHKVFPTEGDRWQAICNGMSDEVTEVLQALHTGDQFGACIEAVDVANMGWLLSLWACSITKEKFVEYTQPAPAESGAPMHYPSDDKRR